MNISNGISEISSNGALYGAQKVWLWPVYNAGKVDPVFRVTRESEGQSIITNVPREEREKLMNEMQRGAGEIYSSSGGSFRNLALPAGTLFDAYV